MKVLFVAVGISPFEINAGSNQRSSLILEACTKFANVDVVSFCSEYEPDGAGYHIIYQKIAPDGWWREGRIKKFRRLLTPWKPETLFLVNREMESVIDGICNANDYDFIVIRYFDYAISCGLLKHSNKLVIDIDDNPADRAMVDSSIVAHSIRNKLYNRLFSKSLKVGLNVVCRKCNTVFFSNIDDCISNKRIFLPNVPYYDSAYTDTGNTQLVDGRIIVVGELSYKPNIQGVTHFLKTVYPLVKQSHPEVTFHIVGRVLDDNLKNEWESFNGVTVTGYVPSLFEEYGSSQIVVIPIYYGAGTCIKVLEAMQMKRPCVVSSRGFRGYGHLFKDKEDCLVAHSDEMFAEYVISLLDNSLIGNKLAQSAYDKQQRHFSKNNFYDIVYSSLTTLKSNGNHAIN